MCAEERLSILQTCKHVYLTKVSIDSLHSVSYKRRASFPSLSQEQSRIAKRRVSINPILVHRRAIEKPEL